jgi:putative CocE/NonD family hydrolase
MWAEATAPPGERTAEAERVLVETTGVAVDGALLATDVFRPERLGRLPALLIRTPYDRRALRDALDVADPFEAARRGWVVVLQDVRGRGRSTGAFGFLADDAVDGAATIAWIAAQPWSDGRVAMAGRSFCGRVQELAAASGAPQLRAIAPETCGSSRDSWHPGGVLSLATASNWIGLLAAAAGLAVERDDPLALVRRLADADDPLARACAVLRPLVLDEPSPWWDAVEPAPERLAAIPCLRTTGWYDLMLAPTVARHAQAQADGAGDAHKLVIGPWTHGELDGRFAGVDHGPDASAAAFGLGRLREAFLTAALDGGALGELPNVHVFVTGANGWRTYDAWPPPTRERAWFLGEADAGTARDDGERALRRAPVAAPRTAGVLLADPADPVPDLGAGRLDVGPFDGRGRLAGRRDVLRYRAAPLERDVELAGSAVLDLLVASDANDFDLMARLWDVHPDGAERHVADGVANRALLGVEEKRGLARVRLTLSPCHHVLRAGHALLLTVQASEFPRYLPNPQTGRRLADGPPWSVRLARHVVRERTAAPSRLLLPVVD